MTDVMVQKIQDATDRVFFPNLGGDNIFTNGIKINKVMFTIGNLEIYWYGFLIALGAFLAMVYAFRKFEKFGINPDRAIDAIIGGFVGAIIGARLYYVVLRWSDYTSSGKILWKEIISIRDGGLAVYGGIIGALLVGALMAKIRKIRIPALFDLGAMGLLIGQAIGRWGNFFNEEAYGSLTKLPWGMTSAKIMSEVVESFPAATQNELVVHPCFLYESLWCILGFVLLNIYMKKRKFDGEIFLLYIGWYGLGRAFIEGLRTDSLMIGEYLRVSQFIAIVCVVASIAAIAIARIKIKDSGNYQFFYETEESKKQIDEYKNPKKKEKKTVEKDLTKAIDNAFDDKENEANIPVIVADEIDEDDDDIVNDNDNNVDNIDNDSDDDENAEDIDDFDDIDDEVDDTDE